ncbi:unnamed protein product [Choristocarpus tenellus]
MSGVAGRNSYSEMLTSATNSKSKSLTAHYTHTDLWSPTPHAPGGSLAGTAAALQFLSSDGSIGDDEFYDALETMDLCRSSSSTSALRTSSILQLEQRQDCDSEKTPVGEFSPKALGGITSGNRNPSSHHITPMTVVPAATAKGELSPVAPQRRVVVSDISSAESTPMAKSSRQGETYFPNTPPGSFGVTTAANFSATNSRITPPPLPPRVSVGVKGLVGPQQQVKGNGDAAADGTTSTSNFPPVDGSEEDRKYMLVNKDTGEVFDMRDLEKHLPSVNYSLLPSRELLMELERRRSKGQIGAREGADSEYSQGASSNLPRNGVGEERQSGIGSARGKAKALAIGRLVRDGIGKVASAVVVSGNGGCDRLSRKAVSDTSSGGVQISFKGKDTSELEGLMLFQELCHHTGPVWTAAFSHTGRFLATAGQDTKVRVYCVSGSDGKGTNKGLAAKETGICEPGVLLPHPKPNSESESSIEVMSIPSSPTLPGGTRGSSSMSSDVPGVGGVGGASSPLSSSLPSPLSPLQRPAVKVPGLLEKDTFRIFEGHTGDVVELTWSRNDFLLSASLDKTVRLWHVSQGACLHCFLHSDIVTSVDFHPVFEHLFLSGCFDKKVRVWNIRDGRVQEWQQAPGMVTAARFSRDGQMIIAGLYQGQVLFYQTQGMRYFTQIECRNRRGPLKSGRKVTGLAFKGSGTTKAGDVAGGSGGAGVQGGALACARKKFGAVDEEVLVTTNDSRLRLYNTEDFAMSSKYKGLSNDSLQIKASFSEDGRLIISGSENGKVYVWNTSGTSRPQTAAVSGGSSSSSSGAKDTNRCHESFVATEGDPSIVTVAAFVPESAARACVIAVRGGLSKDVADVGGYLSCMILASDYEGKVRIFCKAPVLLS